MISFKRLFLIIFIPIALVLSLSLLLIYKNIDITNSEELQKVMKDKWSLVSMYNFTSPTSKDTYDFIKSVANNSSLRITLISTTGLVLIDSHIPYDDIKNMQNHKSRDEVRNAMNDIPYYVIRKSPSTKENTIYFAEKMDSGNILRIAYISTHLDNIGTKAKKETIAIFLMVIVLIALISLYLAHKFSAPIKNLDNIINEIEKGSKDYHLPQFKDSAINKIADMIYKMYTNRNNERITAENGRIRLASILSSMNEAIILLRNDGMVVHFNGRAELILQMKLAIGFDIIASSNDVEAISLFKSILSKGKLFKDKVNFKDRVLELYSKEVGFEELLIVISDVTEKIEYELFKTELVGNITHELKTPISLVMGASETILKDKDMQESIKLRFLETIYRNSVRLNSLVDDTLELHRLESYENSIDIEPVIIEDVFDEVVSLLTLNNDKKIISNIDIASANIANEHLTSILSNLIGNAIKYSKGDKVTVHIYYKNALFIEVADLGPLIPETERIRIFERFYTISKSRTKNSSGSGLGLAIVKHITNKYGGTVKVFQNDKLGNTFQVRLNC